MARVFLKPVENSWYKVRVKCPICGFEITGDAPGVFMVLQRHMEMAHGFRYEIYRALIPSRKTVAIRFLNDDNETIEIRGRMW